MIKDNKFFGNEIRKYDAKIDLCFDFIIEAELTESISYKVVPDGFKNGKYTYSDKFTESNILKSNNQQYSSIELRYKDKLIGTQNDMTIFNFIVLLKSYQHGNLNQYENPQQKNNKEDKINYSIDNNYEAFITYKNTIQYLCIKLKNTDEKVFLNKHQSLLLETKINHVLKSSQSIINCQKNLNKNESYLEI